MYKYHDVIFQFLLYLPTNKIHIIFEHRV